MKKLLILLIKFYQLALSGFLGPCCRFAPSCSEYAKEAIENHGALKGSWLSLKRLAKCSGWHRGGCDPVPSKVNKPKTEVKEGGCVSSSPAE